MLHQTLISSPSAALLFNVCTSNPSSPLRSKVEKEQKMETVATCNQAENFLFSEEMESWGLEKCGEGFSVEDLLNLNDFEDNSADFEDNNELQNEEFAEQMDCNSNSSYNPLPMPSFDDIALPSHDEAAELEWVSLIIDDSISDIPPQPIPKIPAFTATVCAVSTEAPVPVKAKRSKRPRTTASHTSTSSTSSSSSSVSSFLDIPQLPKTQKNKKRGRKPKPQAPAPALGPLVPGAQGERRCTHCGVQKTPQWRAGPLGAKTLCNACGVRYKSGRLLPEYRPACSPTFISDVHSNSHRKVLEMRKKKEEFPGTPVFSF